MPKFFFHIHDGQDWPDSKGIESCDWRSALVLAVRKAGERLVTHAEQIALSDEWWLDVTNSDGLVLYRVNLVIDEDPHAATSS